MDLQLGNRTALVTGASRGLGRAIAFKLAGEGVKTAIVARRGELLRELAAEITSAGAPPPAIIEADLSAPGAPEQIAARAQQDLGRIDMLVNAAGGSRSIPFEATIEQWMEGMTVNFFRLRELTHAVVPGMIANRWGRIVNITGGSEPRGLNAANSAKAAAHIWAKALSREIAKHGVTVNCIKPGRIISEQILRMYPTEESRRDFAAREIPTGRFGKAEELAVLAVFLCSPLAGYITGTAIAVDGGMGKFAF